MKKLLATVLALSCAMAMLVCTAAATDVNTSIEGEYVTSGADGFSYDFSYIGKTPSEMAKITVTFTVGDESLGFGGAIVLNTWVDGFGWASTEWGNDGAGKTITAVSTGNAGEYSISLDTTGAFHGTGEAEEGVYNKIVVQQYWGDPITVTKVEAYDASGALYYSLPATAETPPTETPSTETPSTETPSTEDTPQTGDAMSIVMIAGVAAVALCGVVVCAKKKNA